MENFEVFVCSVEVLNNNKSIWQVVNDQQDDVCAPTTLVIKDVKI
jgi:hypothetical protein